ncbi:cytochrome P450 [Favolaschia claudopus]|uniref:Cytochrome P450 n=1 Tax=Favolaschia claudopus TaxID=2862362 RepID=A0AAW0DZL7_9AGAR
MILPPGLRFLGRTLVIPTCLFLLLQAIVTHPVHGFGLSMWTAPIVAAFALVAFTLARNILVGITHAKEAHAMGARIIPRARGTWPGSVDLMRKMLTAYKTGYLGDSFAALVQALGPVMNIRVLWQDKIFTVAPEHIQMILATDFKNYVKGKQFCDTMDSVLGNGVFNSDGEMWSFHRSMTRPFFARDRFEHFQIFDRHTDTVISLIKRRVQEGHAVDFQDLISRLTMDSATEFLFGSSVDSLACTPPYPHNASATLPLRHDSPRARAANAFTEAYSEAMHQIAFRQRVGPIWPLFEMFHDKTAKPMETVTAYIDPLIHAALEKKRLAEEKGVHSAEDSCLLDELMKSSSDPKLLKDEIINILIAGRDTTMSVLTNLIYLLSTSSDVTARLREEIMAFVGPSERPTYDDIKQMKYLRAVINETMRLFPPVPFNIRQPLESTTWPSPDPTEKPLYIPAGTTIVYSVMVMHRRTDLWGPDAHLFDPDRFLDERAKKYVSHPFRFLPFNAGPRICLGQQFAYNEMSYVIIRLLQNFSSIMLDVDACPPEARVPTEWSGQPGRKGIEQIVPKAHLTLYTQGGLWVKMEDTIQESN